MNSTVVQSNFSNNQKQASSIRSLVLIVRQIWLSAKKNIQLVLHWGEIDLFLALVVIVLGQSYAYDMIGPAVLLLIALGAIAVGSKLVLRNLVKWVVAVSVLILVAYFLARSKLPDSSSFQWLNGLTTEDRKSIVLDGIVVARPERPHPGELRFVFLANLSSEQTAEFLVSAADLPWKSESKIKSNDKLRIEIAVRPHSLSLESPTSYQSSLSRKGILATANLQRLTLRHSSEIINVKERILSKLVNKFGRSDSVAVLLAGTIGFKDLLSSEIKDLFRDTGTSHILVVSGYHVGILYGTIYWLIIRLVSRFRFLLHYVSARIPAACGALLVTVVYSVVCGVEVPIFRAAFLLTVVVIGTILGRKCFSLRNYFLAATIVLFIWPGAFLEAGFQLTFAAVAGLLIASRIIEHWQPTSWFGSVVGATLLYSTMAWLATSPIVLFWFHQFVPLSALINLVVVPPFSFLSIAAGAVGTIAAYFDSYVIEMLLRAILSLNEFIIQCLRWIRELSQSIGLGVVVVSDTNAKSWGYTVIALNALLVLWVLKLGAEPKAKLV